MRWWGPVPAVMVALALIGPAEAQEGTAYAHTAAHGHPHGTAVAVALRLPAGTMHDPEGQEGTAWILARTLERQAARALGPEVDVSVTVSRMATQVRLIALPPAWEGAARTLERVLFRSEIDADLAEEERLQLLRGLSFEVGSPVRDFQAEAAVILAEPDPYWARPPRGTPESLARIDVGALEAYRASFYRKDRVAQAVVGPLASVPQDPTFPSLDPDSGSVADTVVAESLSVDSLRLDSLAAPSQPPDAIADIAWITGYRREIMEAVTNSWITVAYPVPSDLPRTHLEFIVHLLGEELDPVPPDPDRYGVDVRIVEAPRGPVLVAEASVFPEAADRWEARIIRAVRSLATVPVPDEFFHWRRRRFRATRLLSEVEPEAEAARMAGDLLRSGKVRELGPEIWSLDAQAVLAAAASLGEPRILRMGPDLAQEGTGGR